MKLQVRRLRKDAILPEYKTSGAAGLDLTAALDAPVTIEPGRRRLIPTGIAVALPAGCEGQVRPRSGLARDHGVTVLNAPGTVDEDYRGEIGVVLVNHGEEPFTVRVSYPKALLKMNESELECIATSSPPAGTGTTANPSTIETLTA